MGRQALFVRVAPNPIKIGGHQVNQGDEVVADFDVLDGLPGMTFVNWEEEPSTEVSKEKDEPKPKVLKALDIVEEKQEPLKTEPSLDPDTLAELKSRTSREWMIMKKVDLIAIMEEAGIDYSKSKQDRMSLYKFLIDKLKEM